MGLKIGDKIKWDIPIGGDVIYTIIDIDLNRDGDYIYPMCDTSYGQVLFRYLNREDKIVEQWAHNYHNLNVNYLLGKITKIKEEKIEPEKKIKKWKLN